jgi:phospholipid/cholesterol/gamma-HCH transport system substrate-binding protein
MRDDQRNYVVVGVFVIAMVVGLVVWIAMITGRTGATDAYYIRYDAVPGLAKGAQIFFDGYPVGRIESIKPQDNRDERRFRLDVSVEQGWKIPDDSEAKIVAGFLAAVFINIEGGDSKTYLEPGDQIPSVEATDLIAEMTETVASLRVTLADLKPQVEGIVDDLSLTMDQVNSLLSPQNTGRVATILENLEAVSEEIKGMTEGLTDTRRRLDRVLIQVDGLIAENKDEISRAVADFRESVEALARHAEAIAYNLEVTTRNMNEFSQQIRENPGVLLRGRNAADEPAGSNR